MIETVAHPAALAGLRPLTQDRGDATATLAAIASPLPCARPPIDRSRLEEAAHACGYDVHRVSRHLGVSVRHLQRWFVAHMSCTPGVWLIEQRLQHARRLLAASTSVKEVAYSVGFKQVSQFSRDFKRRFGHRPSSQLAQRNAQWLTKNSSATGHSAADSRSAGASFSGTRP
jgi:AraC-like DNA-binding protein